MAFEQQSTRRAQRIEGEVGAYALVLTAPHAGTVLVLPTSGEAIAGREQPADLIVADDTVSRRHARILGGSPPEIEDLGSTNGTRVMGRLLQKGEREPLALGSVVELGSVVGIVRPASAIEDRSHAEQGRESAPRAAATIAPPPLGGRRARPEAILADATMKRLYDLVDVLAPSKISVLVLGETGVGKDVYAETLHGSSPRASAPFVRLNCAALPESLLESELFGYERGAFTGAQQAKPGLFEAADGGTMFLDEIGEMPLATQAKLLRVLESGEVMRIGSVKPKRVDVRFLSATNRDLEALSRTGAFRLDLFFRLNGASILIPPLRRRVEDIVPLAKRFLELTGSRGAITPDAAAKLSAHRWPGNIRELKNVIDRAALLARGGDLHAEHLMLGTTLLSDSAGPPSVIPAHPIGTAPAAPAAPPDPATTTMRDHVAEVERRRILDAMDRCGGNQSRAAKMLGISRTTLIKRLEQYGHVRPRKGQDDE